VVGLDLSPAAVEAVSREARAKEALRGAAFVLGDATRMPFHADAFDLILDKATLDARSMPMCIRCQQFSAIF
jgi:ubiquinone/menaquinone biosynthesis C-methylase UbiE